MTLNESEKQARTRFAILSAARASGVILMLLGMGILASGAIEPRDIVGGVLLIAGVIDSLLVPRLLARRWRSPEAE